MYASLETKKMMNNTVCAIYFMLPPHLLLSYAAERYIQNGLKKFLRIGINGLWMLRRELEEK